MDFVAGPRRELDVVEVKYRRHIDLRGASAVAKTWQGPVRFAPLALWRLFGDCSLYVLALVGECPGVWFAAGGSAAGVFDQVDVV